jgi:hypothetical protein
VNDDAPIAGKGAEMLREVVQGNVAGAVDAGLRALARPPDVDHQRRMF